MKKLFLIGVLALGLITTVQAANEGIKVHGHWQFDIYNKDGSFDRKVEFENALVTGGGALISSFLTGSKTSGAWIVSVSSTNPGLCDSSSDCVMTDINLVPPTDLSLASGDIFPTLSVTNVSANVVLSGSVIIGSNSAIDRVFTNLYWCSSAITPDSCFYPSGQRDLFTLKDLSASPVAVQAGQTVNVTVTISFS